MKRLDIPSLVSFLRFQYDPSALPHFKVIVRINEDRLLECSLADFIVSNSGKEFVAAIGLDDFEAKVFHDPGRIGWISWWRIGCRGLSRA